MLSHILPPAGGSAAALQWAALAMVAACGCLAIRGRRGLLQNLGCAGVCAAGAVIVGLELAPGPPPRPAYLLSLVEPPAGAALTSNVRVAACGRLPQGGAAEVPGPGLVLSASIDGREAGMTSGPALVIRAPTGAHTLHVEVLTGDHRQFQPPLATEQRLLVAGAAAARPNRPCPR